MKLPHRKVLLAFGALLLAFACSRADGPSSDVMSTGRPVGDVRGTALIDKLIRARLLDEGDASALNFRVEKLGGPEIEQLKALLGQYADGGSSDFRGGEPNPFGMMLWHQVVTRFGQGMGAFCATPDGTDQVTFTYGGSAKLNAAFAKKLRTACAWPEAADARLDAAQQLWRGVMGYAVPDEEAAFKELFVGAQSPFAGATTAARVEAMFVAMMLNPHFLLEK